MNGAIDKLVTLSDNSLSFAIYFNFLYDNVTVHCSRGIIRVLFNIKRKTVLLGFWTSFTWVTCWCLLFSLVSIKSRFPWLFLLPIEMEIITVYVFRLLWTNLQTLLRLLKSLYRLSLTILLRYFCNTFLTLLLLGWLICWLMLLEVMFRKFWSMLMLID